jgi:predicted nucleotidyltransferase
MNLHKIQGIILTHGLGIYSFDDLNGCRPLKQKHLDTLRRVLLPFSEKIEKVGLFGSRATGLYSSNSDIDLVIYGLVDEKTVDRIFTLLKDSNLPFKTDIQAYDLIKYLPLKKHIDINMVLLFTHKQLLN